MAQREGNTGPVTIKVKEPKTLVEVDPVLGAEAINKIREIVTEYVPARIGREVVAWRQIVSSDTGKKVVVAFGIEVEQDLAIHIEGL